MTARSVTGSSDSLLTGAFNFRDLGGLPTVDGTRLRRGRLFRSDTLQALTAHDEQLLFEELGVRCILDLRTASEAATEGGPVHGDTCYVNIPLQSVQNSQSASRPRLADIYLHHLDDDSNLPKAVELLARLLPRPTVVHCASGKDRTGIVAALVLGLVGATREAIISDYLRSGPNMPPIIERFRSYRLPDELFHCTESAIVTFLDAVEQRYGGFAGWARQAGISEAAVSRLRQALTEPRPEPDEPQPDESGAPSSPRGTG